LSARAQFAVAQALPSGWETRDIGAPVRAGSATYSSGVYTVHGSGTNICCTSDQFRFVYRQVTGDAEIVAFVSGLQAANEGSKAGVMIRSTLTASSPHTFMFVFPSGSMMRSRLLTDGTSVDSAIAMAKVPFWVRLVREGNLFTAYVSSDGSQWTLVGTEVVLMPSTVDVGLAVTSAKKSSTATATFSNVTVTTPVATNKLPTVSIASPLNNATYTAPANIPITATAGDVDGSITTVAFYASGTLKSTDTTSPFGYTWTNVPAGTYSLTAIATDNTGASVTSSPVSVTVSSTPVSPLPTKVVFVPPTNYATAVTSETIQLRRATDSTTSAPIATMNLGKPAVVSGEISADISTIVDPLPAGGYYAVVVSTGPGGSTPSAPSATFTK
jgi:regulation of enolase protein 1 (concanavalin A-like superfamily)